MRASILYLYLPLVLIGASTTSSAGPSFPPCTPEMIPGTECVGTIEEIHPTQPQVGMAEVRNKTKEYSQLSQHDLEKLKLRKVAPVIVAPDLLYYLVDHHHTLLALSRIGEEKVFLKIQNNWSNLEPGKNLDERMRAFWKKMKATHNCFLEDANRNLVDPLGPKFPQHLKDCTDNPYRSLVSDLLEDKIIESLEMHYYEFYVGRILRGLGLIYTGDHTKEAKKEAEKLLETRDGKTAMRQLKESFCNNRMRGK